VLHRLKLKPFWILEVLYRGRSIVQCITNNHWQKDQSLVETMKNDQTIIVVIEQSTGKMSKSLILGFLSEI
jgi:hypothetical protein